MSKITDDVMIDAKKVNLMRLRIIKEERDNEETNSKSPAQMVDRLKKIIEEEADFE